MIECKKINPSNYLEKLLCEYRAKTLIGLSGNIRKIFNAYNKGTEVEGLTNISSNGSLMRSWPIGLMTNNQKLILQYSEKQSKLTHNSKEAIEACQILASLISLGFYNKQTTKDEFRKYASQFLNCNFLSLQKDDFINQIRAEYYHPEWDVIPPGAMVTLKAVLYSVYTNYSEFDQALYCGLSFGGDTDSVASLIGALMGSRLGLNQIPKDWCRVPNDLNFGGYNELIALSEEFRESFADFENLS